MLMSIIAMSGAAPLEKQVGLLGHDRRVGPEDLHHRGNLLGRECEK